MKLTQTTLSTILIYFIINTTTISALQNAQAQKLSKEHIYHMLEGRGAFAPGQVPELKDKIAGYLREETEQSLRDEYDTILSKYHIRSLQPFIPSGTTSTKATFVDEDKLLLINFPKSQLDAPPQIALVDTQTFRSKKLETINHMDHVAALKYFHAERENRSLLFMWGYVSGLKLHNLTDQKKINIGNSCPVGLTEDKKYFIHFHNSKKEVWYPYMFSKQKESNVISFFDTDSLHENRSKDIVTLRSDDIAHHAKKRMLACQHSWRCHPFKTDIMLLYNYSTQNSQLLNWDHLAKVGDNYKNMEFNYDGSLLLVNLSKRVLLFKTAYGGCVLDAPIHSYGIAYFFDNHTIATQDEFLHYRHTQVKRSYKPDLPGKEIENNKKGVFIIEKRCPGGATVPHLAKFISANTSNERSHAELAQLTLKQKLFIELLYALSLTYEERLGELKKESPEKYSDVIGLKVMLKYIPERVEAFTHEDVQETWASFSESAQKDLKKSFRVS